MDTQRREREREREGELIRRLNYERKLQEEKKRGKRKTHRSMIL